MKKESKQEEESEDEEEDPMEVEGNGKPKKGKDKKKKSKGKTEESSEEEEELSRKPKQPSLHSLRTPRSASKREKAEPVLLPFQEDTGDKVPYLALSCSHLSVISYSLVSLSFSFSLPFFLSPYVCLCFCFFY